MRFVVTLLFVVTFIPPAYAGMQFVDRTPGSFVDAPGIATEIEVDINGVIARTRIIQYFANQTDAWQEGVYTWPLPDNAAVDHQVMVIGDRRILGFVAEKEKARQIYETAKREGKATSIVEQHRANIFRTSVANIPPHSLIAVEIGYQNEVAIDNGHFTLRLPMAITPRYDNFSPLDFLKLATSNTESGSAVREVAERLALFDFAGGNNPVSLQVHLDAGFDIGAIASPSHDIAFKKPQDGVTMVRPKKTVLPGEQDFVLDWTPLETDRPLTFLHSEQLDGEYYSHLVAVPPLKTAAFKPAKPRPRQISMIIDVSGSMAGPSIRQAKAALIEALQDLSPGDSFNVIAFQSFTTGLFPQSRPASRENVNEALKWVAGLEADGGTEMLPAVELALDEGVMENHLRQVVFITDGAIGYEDRLQRYIAEHVGEARFYAVGIGAAPNGLLMRKMAAAGRGTFTFIGDTAQTQEKMAALFAKMKQPVLTDLVLSVPQDVRAEVIPAKIPDLMAGAPVTLTIKSDRKLHDLRLTGRHGKEDWMQDIAPEGNAASAAGIGKLYARAKIESLEFADPLKEKPETATQITALALAHQITSAYTSLVAVDEQILRPQNGALVSRRYDPSLPKGWQLAPFDPREAASAYDALLQAQRESDIPQNQRNQDINLPQTATNWIMQLVTGLALILMALVLLRRGMPVCDVKHS